MRVLFIDKSTKLKTVNDLQTGARGGMVSSLFIVSDGLARLGHDVMVYGGIEQPGTTQDGVYWVNEYPEIAFDVMVLNRGIGIGYPHIRAKHRILWTHDLPHNGFIPEPQNMMAFSGAVYMSDYARHIWQTFYPVLKKRRGWMIPNGVDKDLFYPRKKDPDYLLYISAPNRGLRRLPLIYEAVKSKLGRNIRMRAYSNGAVLHPNEGPDTFTEVYEAVAASGVEVLDPVPQSLLAEELGRAGGMVLPTDYPEICSNSILQSLASGTPVFTTGGIGSAPEWIKHGKNGMLTQFQPYDYLIYQLEMVRNLSEVLDNPRLHRKMQKKAARTKGIYAWQEIVKQWHRKLTGLG